MLPHERKLLTDRQLREASRDQIEDLVHRLNLILREREEPGQLVWSLTSEELAIEAPQEATEPPSEATPQPGGVEEPQPAVEGTQEAQESPEMAMPSAGGGPYPATSRRPQSAPGGVGCLEDRRLDQGGR
jgi:hypothetical protein